MDHDVQRLSPADVGGVGDRVRLDGDRALVTGAGNGIGRVAAFAFAAAGADVALTDRLADDVAATADAVAETFDVEVVTTTADVSDPDEVADMIDAAAASLGGLDVLVNVAGTTTREASAELSTKRWDLIQNVNLRGPFLAAREAYPHLRGGGRIVNVSSIAGLFGASSMSHYGAAKAGVRNLTASLAREWAGSNVRVNAVAPGAILTAGAAGLFGDASADAYDRDRVDREIGSPAEVADAMLFLASPLSSFVSGETLRVGGPPPTQEDVTTAFR